MIKILFVCYGNICRSPMAEMIFKHLIKEKGVEKDFVVDSMATSDEDSRWSSPIYSKTKEVLRKHNVFFTEHYATQMTKHCYDNYDYIIGMEDRNVRDILNIVGRDTDNKVYRLLDFTDKPSDIDDPWYHRNFDKTFNDIMLGCQNLLEKLLKIC